MKQSTIVAIRKDLQEAIRTMKKSDNVEFSIEEVPIVAIRDKDGYLEGIMTVDTSLMTNLEGR